MASDQSSSFDVLHHQTRNIDSAVNRVGMKIEALVDGQNALADALYRRTRDCILEQHAETRNTMKLITTTIEDTGKTLQQQVQADLNRILAEMHTEVQGWYSKLDDAVVRKLPAIEGDIMNQQASLNESLV
jgi:hypothetical protein